MSQVLLVGFVAAYLVVGVIMLRLLRGRLNMLVDLDGDDYAVVGVFVLFWPPLVITLAAIPILSLVGRLVMGRPKL